MASSMQDMARDLTAQIENIMARWDGVGDHPIFYDWLGALVKTSHRDCHPSPDLISRFDTANVS